MNNTLRNVLKKKKCIIIYSPSFKNNNEAIFKKINSQSIICLPIYTTNPDYYLIKEILLKIEKINFKYIVAIGGGKTLDTAKILKYLLAIKRIKKKLWVIPTIYGSGSESTSSAVYYVNFKKYSIQSKYIESDKIINIAELPMQAPKFFTKVSAMDCLCQSIESIWSIKANQKSIKLAEKSFRLSYDFLNTKLFAINKQKQNNIVIASKLIGQAMNISRTTAPHALSYPLSSYLNIPHGQAVCLTMKVLLEKNLNKIKNNKKFEIYKKIFKARNIDSICLKFNNLINSLKINSKLNLKKSDIRKFVSQVNAERLANNPLNLSKKDIIDIYKKL